MLTHCFYRQLNILAIDFYIADSGSRAKVAEDRRTGRCYFFMTDLKVSLMKELTPYECEFNMNKSQIKRFAILR